jgi:adenylate cyclase
MRLDRGRIVEAIRRLTRQATQQLTAHAAWVAALVALNVSLLVVLVPRLAAYWDRVELFGFDELTILTAPNKTDLPITIIGIDDESMEKLGIPWPWPRTVHAELVDRLAKAGVIAIGMDVVFDLPSQDPKADQAFAEAIKRAGNVVLAADRQVKEDVSSGIVEFKLTEPLPPFVEAGAVVGYANVDFDASFAVRRVTDHDQAFWKQIARKLAKAMPDRVSVGSPPEGAYFRYLGDVGTFTYIPYHVFLSAPQEDLNKALANSVVLVGRNLRVSTDINMAAADLFFTPFTARSRVPTPGVELHATMIANAVDRAWIRPAGRFWTLIAAIFCVAFCTFTMRKWHPVWSAGPLLAAWGLLAALAWVLFRFQGIWLPVATAMLAAAIIYAWLGGVYFLVVRRRFNETYRALVLYLPPAVAKRVAENPELLKLSGERRMITLMFTDLAGFTKLSEKLPPERVQALLNRHFTEMVALVQGTAVTGTVDKFIGDAIMAFWGAPLDDPDHAFHGVSVAIRAQEAMVRLREELAAEGLPAVHMRVGLNSGEAVTGNMGSDKRLAYTAIGDNVNLAARLEGINKLYGTNIIVSESTARMVGERIAMRLLDKVKVSGKSETVTIYTPSRGTEAEKQCEEAFRLYLRREFEASRALWAALHVANPDDKTPIVFLERIEAFMETPPPPDWDGSVALEKF